MAKTTGVKIATSAVAIVVLLVLSVAAPAFAATPLVAHAAPTRTPIPPRGDAIPLKPLTDLASLNASARLAVDGLIDGKRARGNLDVVLATNDQEQSRITVTGGLLAKLVSQVGGSLAGLFSPSSVDIYQVPQGSYVTVNGLFPMCVKLRPAQGTAGLEAASPTSLLSMLTAGDVARGKLVGQEKLHGMTVKHYVIDGDEFLAAARRSSDPSLRQFGQALWSADDADLYVDARSGYPVAYRGGFGGAYEPIGFEGDFDVQIELTGVNGNTPIKLPASCSRPISQ